MEKIKILNFLNIAIESFTKIDDLIHGVHFNENEGLQIKINQDIAAETIGILNPIIDKYAQRYRNFGPHEKKVDIFRKALTIDSFNGCAILKDAIAELKMVHSLIKNNVEDEISIEDNNQKENKQKVFIVHGHNQELKQNVARVIEKLNLIPIILHEQSNEGRTVIEKFEKHSDVSYAIVLLTFDDLGSQKSNLDQNKRARQNVVLELGYFLAKLGRKNVLPLYEEGVELPSDISGVLYTLIDNSESWKYNIVRELKEVGFKVDANALL